MGCSREESYQKLVATKEEQVARQAAISKAYQNIFIASKQIQSGDLVTRTGSDFTSESLRMLNRRNTSYSHCGIASIENDSVFVYHALGGEWNPDEKIRRDYIADFADPYNNKKMAIFNFQVDALVRKNLMKTVHDLYKNAVMFDMAFDLKTDDRMYCAEFVYKCFLKASAGAIKFHHSYLKNFEFIGVDDIFLDPASILKQEIVYK